MSAPLKFLRSFFIMQAAAAALDVIPRQLHLSLAGADSGSSAVRVAYFTVNATASVCAWGPAGGPLNSSAEGSSVQYLTDGGWHHVVKMDGLAFGASYQYSCGNGSASSPPVTFSAPLAPGAAVPFQAIIFGDWGWQNSSVRSVMLPVGGLASNWTANPSFDLLASLAPNSSLLWMVGDIAYADDSFGHIDELLGFGYEKAYNGFMETDWLGSVSGWLPVMTSVGNHESECHDPYCILNENVGQQLRNFSAYNARWAMPSAESGGVGAMWHSWELGRVHFVSLDTETCPGCGEEKTGDSHFPLFPAGGFAPEGAYMAWLERDLAAAAASRAAGSLDFIVAGGHRPFEDFNSAAVKALFAKYGVAMYFAGHTHSYLRFDASAYGDGTAHVTVGGAGCDEMAVPKDQAPAVDAPGYDAAASCAAWCRDERVREHLPETQEPCRYCEAAPVYVSDQYAIGTLQVDEAGDLVWRLLHAPDGRVLDSVKITKAQARARL